MKSAPIAYGSLNPDIGVLSLKVVDDHLDVLVPEPHVDRGDFGGGRTGKIHTQSAAAARFPAFDILLPPLDSLFT